MPVQPPSFSEGTIRARRGYRIYWRELWTDVWSLGVDLFDGTSDFVDLVMAGPIEQRLNPAIDTAILTWRSGEVKDEDVVTFISRVTARFVNSFVKIVLLNEPPARASSNAGGSGSGESAGDFGGEGGPVDEEVLFVGYIPEETLDALGHISDESPDHRTNQSVAAYGLELLLDRNTIGESFCANTGVEYGVTDWVRKVTHVLTFNQMYERGWPNLTTDAELTRQGNRSPKRFNIPPEDSQAPEAHVFYGGSGLDSDPTATKPAVWSAYDIAEYMLAAFAPTNITWRLKPDRVANPDTNPPVTTPADKLFMALYRYKPMRLNAQGRTVKDVLDELFNKDLGLSWRVNFTEEIGEFDEVSEIVEIEVLSLVDVDVSFGSETVLPASAYATDIVLSPDDPIAAQVIQAAVHNKYGTIIVEGQRVLVCFTMLVQGSPGEGADPDGELVPAWTAAEEAAYVTAVGGSDAEANDRYRAADFFRHVFTTLRVRRDWNLLPINSGILWNIGVGVNNDGTLITGSTGQFVRLWGNAFENFVPIQASETQTDFDKEYLPPIVIIKDTAGKWNMIDRQPGPSASLRMLDRELGIEINATPNHLIADGVSFSAHATGTEPAFKYQTMRVTVALRTDRRLSVTQTIPEFDPERVLRVLVEDAESWWIVPGTVVDINADNTLRIHAGGVVRTDHKRLGQIAAMIKAWFGRDRRTLSLQLKMVQTGARPGDVLKNLIETDGSAGSYSTALATPVTSRRIDLEKQTTDFSTDFMEPVFKRLARRIT